MTADLEMYANLVFLSYRYSQGGIGTQNRLLLWLEEYHHPDIFAAGHRTRLLELTHAKVARVFLNQRLHPATAIPWDEPFDDSCTKTVDLVTNELASLFGRFTHREPLRGFSSDVAGIAASVAAMDLDYLSRPGGRSGDSEALMIVVSTFQRDPWDSLFVRHGVRQLPTGTVEYDELFGMMGSPEVLSQLDRHALDDLESVLAIYLDRHPEHAEIVKTTRDRVEVALHG